MCYLIRDIYKILRYKEIFWFCTRQVKLAKSEYRLRTRENVFTTEGSFIFCRFGDAYTSCKRLKTEGDTVICHFFFPRIWRLLSVKSLSKWGKSRWSFDGDSLKRGESRGEVLSVKAEVSIILSGIIGGFEREKLLHPLNKVYSWRMSSRCWLDIALL